MNMYHGICYKLGDEKSRILAQRVKFPALQTEVEPSARLRNDVCRRLKVDGLEPAHPDLPTRCSSQHLVSAGPIRRCTHRGGGSRATDERYPYAPGAGLRTRAVWAGCGRPVRRSHRQTYLVGQPVARALLASSPAPISRSISSSDRCLVSGTLIQKKIVARTPMPA